jgi:hypothetical protein
MPQDPPASLDEQIGRLDQRIERLQAYMPPVERTVAERQESSIPRLCPLCSLEMEPGQVSVHDTKSLGNVVLAILLGPLLLFLGLAEQSCWFRPAAGGKERLLFRPGSPVKAYRCPRCGFVAIKCEEPRGA